MLSAIRTLKHGRDSPKEINVMVEVRKSSIKFGIYSENGNYPSRGFCPLQRPVLVVMILLSIIIIITILSNRGGNRGGESDPFDIFIFGNYSSFPRPATQ